MPAPQFLICYDWFMAKLFIVPTPIGNLKDITLRAIETLKDADLIACEDTRISGKLLKHFTIKKPLISYHEHNVLTKIPIIINKIKVGQNVALVSDAGTPTISDPGYKLVRECLKNKIEVESIPGPSAITTALVMSGFPTDRFLFIGYPPHKTNKRKKFIQNLAAINSPKLTIIMFESPHRLLKTLGDLKEVFGDIDICLCRELTKFYEEIRREKISASINHFNKTKPRGEFTLVFNN